MRDKNGRDAKTSFLSKANEKLISGYYAALEYLTWMEIHTHGLRVTVGGQRGVGENQSKGVRRMKHGRGGGGRAGENG